MTMNLQLQVQAEPRLLSAVRAAVRAYLANAGIEGDRLDEAVLAVDEACTNCIRHAYGNNPAQSFGVALGEDEQGIVVTVSDRGQPCPEEKFDAPPPALPQRGTVAPGGLGMQLIKRAFDTVHYAAEGDCGNRMEMRLRRKPD